MRHAAPVEPESILGRIPRDRRTWTLLGLLATGAAATFTTLALIAYTLYGDRSIRLPRFSARATARPQP